jgi:hypothetical protein
MASDCKPWMAQDGALESSLSHSRLVQLLHPFKPADPSRFQLPFMPRMKMNESMTLVEQGYVVNDLPARTMRHQ